MVVREPLGQPDEPGRLLLKWEVNITRTPQNLGPLKAIAGSREVEEG